MKYLTDLEESVEKHVGFNKTEKGKMLLRILHD